jgi:2-dehydropantoate 2-reductase
MGPVGQILAVHLAKAGCDVAIYDHGKEKINLIRQHGIKLDGRIKQHAWFNNAYMTMDEFMSFGPEILFFAVKSYHMEGLLSWFAGKNLPPDLRAVSVQNGIDVERETCNVFQESGTLRMVLNFAGNLHSPNSVNVTFFNAPNYIASVDDSQQELAKWIADTLTGVKLDTQFMDSFRITDRIWEKTILNSSISALCGISRLTIREAMECPDTVEIIEQAILEAVEVARANEIRFPENFVKLCLRYYRKAGDHFPSMAVDMIGNKETEIDYFNGKIVEYGRKHYIRTPLNLTFTNLVKAASFKNKLVRNNRKSKSETILDI